MSVALPSPLSHRRDRYDGVVLNGLAFIFDMDGVLIDSTELHVAAWRQYLLAQGLEVDDLPVRMLGRHNDDLVRDLFRDLNPDEHAVVQHGAAKERLYREMTQPVLSSRLVPGAVEFLRRHPAVPKAVATNAEQANLDFVLDAAGIRECFQAAITGRDAGRPKPYPDIYLRAAALLGVSPANCIVFEDSETGVRAARDAGMMVVGVTTTLSVLKGVELSIPDFFDDRVERWLASVLTVR